jgi:hypothetical protein
VAITGKTRHCDADPRLRFLRQALAGPSTAVEGGFLKDRTGWPERKDSSLGMLKSKKTASTSRIAFATQQQSGSTIAQEAPEGLDERITWLVCLLCSAIKPHGVRNAQRGGKFLKDLVGAPGLEPGTR